MIVVMPVPKLSVVRREIAAFAKQAWLLRHDIRRDLPERVKPGEDVVVCLHGLFATAGVLRPLRKRLERHEGVHTASLSYPVGPGVKVLAHRLHDLMSTLPDSVRVHLLGHSVGGVVARYFAQEMPDPRVIQTISVASPFAGVDKFSWVGMDVARDLDPSSALLRTIRLGSTRALGPAHLSLIAENDAVVRAPLSHALPGGDVTVIRRCGHNAMLFHDETSAPHRATRPRRQRHRFATVLKSSIPNGFYGFPESPRLSGSDGFATLHTSSKSSSFAELTTRLDRPPDPE